MELACCICLYARRGRPSDAELVIRGYAVCAPHAGIVAQGAEWNAILRVAKEVEHQPATGEYPDIGDSDRRFPQMNDARPIDGCGCMYDATGRRFRSRCICSPEPTPERIPRRPMRTHADTTEKARRAGGAS